jgi:putative transposase
MAKLFNNKYRIPSARLEHWDYANEAMYFVTICTKNRAHYFGDVVEPITVGTPPIVSEAVLQPTEIALIAQTEWYKTLELRPDMNLELGEFVVMPNHIHGIVIIGPNEYNRHSPNWIDPNYENEFGPQRKNLASIMRGYKGAVTTYARINNIEFDWQPRFHDNVIRSMEEYYRISNYIINNLAKWKEDRFYNNNTNLQ